MTDLYLICHKVHGEPAFDVAVQMTCPCCSEHDEIANEWVNPKGCTECDSTGFWWIIPTSGHRAYPWWSRSLEAAELNGGCNKNLIELAGEMPPGLPDHYPTSASPDKPKLNLTALMPKSAPIRRRV